MSLIGINNSVETKLAAGSASAQLPTVLTQTEKHHSRSEKYSVVQTGEIIKQFEKAGFTWQLIAKEKPRKADYRGFETHVLAFEHPELTLGDGLDKEMKPRLYLRNSYHGRSRLRFDFGLIRFYCLNGLVLGSIFESFMRKHIGITQAEVDGILDESRGYYMTKIAPFVRSLAQQTLSNEQALAFAKMAVDRRLEGVNDIVSVDYSAALTAHRPEDQAQTAWNVLNRAQENLGLSFRAPASKIQYVTERMDDEKGVLVRKEMSIRSLKNIQQVTELNRFLFDAMGNVLNSGGESQEAMAA